MDTKELFLKTAFCCIACDGSIATDEVEMLRSFLTETDVFEGLDVNSLLEEYVNEINGQGGAFLKGFVLDLSDVILSKEEALMIVEIAIRSIESDNEIKYSEISFFKKIRSKLPLTDTEILERFPDKEDYLLPDIVQEEFEFFPDASFNSFSV
jgi:hypothetical protein